MPTAFPVLMQKLAKDSSAAKRRAALSSYGLSGRQRRRLLESSYKGRAAAAERASKPGAKKRTAAAITGASFGSVLGAGVGKGTAEMLVTDRAAAARNKWAQRHGSRNHKRHQVYDRVMRAGRKGIHRSTRQGMAAGGAGGAALAALLTQLGASASKRKAQQLRAKADDNAGLRAEIYNHLHGKRRLKQEAKLRRLYEAAKLGKHPERSFKFTRVNKTASFAMLGRGLSKGLARSAKKIPGTRLGATQMGERLRRGLGRGAAAARKNPRRAGQLATAVGVGGTLGAGYTAGRRRSRVTVNNY